MHGVNFKYTRPGTFEKITMFPVVWDVRGTGLVYRDYVDAYGLPHRVDPVLSLLAEAQQSGFNAAIVRSELSRLDVPGPYGTCNDLMAETTNAIRETGMNVIVGGFWTNFWKVKHNDAVFEYLYDYVHQTALMYDGDVIGIFGFDEPAVKYLENPDEGYRWLNMVNDYASRSRELIRLPFTSFISKYGRWVEYKWEFYSDTTCVLNRFSRYLDIITFNMYPVKNNNRRTITFQVDTDSILFCGATDLLPSPSPYYEVFCDQDEFYTVSNIDGNCRFHVYEFDWGYNFENFRFDLTWEAYLPFRPTNSASSDFRSSDTGGRAGGYRNINGAVVLWDSLAPAGEEIVIYFDSSDLVLSSLPEFPGSDSAEPHMFCVGETAYWRSGRRPDGVVGRGDTAILGVYIIDGSELCIVVFSRTAEEEFQFTLCSFPPLSDFIPERILWGRFWNDPEGVTGHDYTNSGFILMNDEGSYITCRPSASNDDWILDPVGGVHFKNLFGEYDNPISVFITREDSGEPVWATGIDFVSAVFEDRFVRSRSDTGASQLSEVRVTEIHGQGVEILSASSYRPDKRYGDVLLCITDEGIQQSGSSINDSERNEQIDLETVSYASGQELFSGARVLNTRKAIRSGVLVDSSGICLVGAELYWDYFDTWRFEVYPQCFETAMNMGALTTDLDNCVFANIQAYGRHAFGLPSYCASQDTMLYMVTAPLIRGCRGLVFYSMDLALRSGNLRSDGMLRYPSLLQNWGPSRDHGNIDVCGRIHNAIAILTGNQSGGGPDFLEALVDGNYIPISDENVYNCVLESTGFTPQLQNTTLNFLAIENTRDANILLLISNDSNYPVPSGQAICFPGRFAEDYSIRTVGGFSPLPETAPASDCLCQERIYDNRGAMGLILDMSGMLPVSVSLLELEPAFSGEYPGGSTFLDVQFYGGGSVNLRFKVTGIDESMLSLYDLSGRKTETIWAGSSFPGIMEIELDPSQRPSGLYFAVLESKDYFISRKVMMFQ